MPNKTEVVKTEPGNSFSFENRIPGIKIYQEFWEKEVLMFWT